MIFSPSRVCGIVFCYNEEHILGDCLRYYLSQGFDFVVPITGRHILKWCDQTDMSQADSDSETSVVMKMS